MLSMSVRPEWFWAHFYSVYSIFWFNSLPLNLSDILILPRLVHWFKVYGILWQFHNLHGSPLLPFISIPSILFFYNPYKHNNFDFLKNTHWKMTHIFILVYLQSVYNQSDSYTAFWCFFSLSRRLFSDSSRVLINSHTSCSLHPDTFIPLAAALIGLWDNQGYYWFAFSISLFI